MLIQDNFDRADSDSLGSNWTETETNPGDIVIQNNKVKFYESGSITYNTPLTVTRHRDMSFDVFGVPAALGVDRYLLAYLAFQDANNFLALRINSDSGGVCSFIQMSGGVQTILGTFVQDICTREFSFLIRQIEEQIQVFVKRADFTEDKFISKLLIFLTAPDLTTPVQKFSLITTSTTFEFNNFMTQTTDRGPGGAGSGRSKMDYDLCRSRNRD
jgi:hypothetical protein